MFFFCRRHQNIVLVGQDECQGEVIIAGQNELLSEAKNSIQIVHNLHLWRHWLQLCTVQQSLLAGSKLEPTGVFYFFLLLITTLS